MKINLHSKNRRYTASFIFICASLMACKKNTEMTISPEISDKMVLVYIAANNNLQTEAINSIKKIQMGFSPAKGRALLVFAKTTAENSYLLKIKHSDANRVVSDTLKTYKNRNSSDPSFLQTVIADSRQLYPANSYGLVLWSHATSWAPPANAKISTKSFGYDDEEEMDIKDLNRILPDDFEYLMFDACSMASTEVCFELKNKAKYILASPAEVLSTSFPYDEISDDLFEGLEGLNQVALKFINFYKSQQGLSASATISLVDTRLMDSIAHEAEVLLSAKLAPEPFNREKIQLLDFEAGAGVQAYDFVSFLKNNYLPGEYESLKREIEKAVIFKGTTNSFLGAPIKEFCGLSVYLPEADDPYKTYYSTLNWSVKSGWNKLFFQ